MTKVVEIDADQLNYVLKHFWGSSVACQELMKLPYLDKEVKSKLIEKSDELDRLRVKIVNIQAQVL